MTGKELYQIWAPDGARWVNWARPVSFVTIENSAQMKPAAPFMPSNSLQISQLKKETGVIIDLPSNESIKEGIALAQVGWRPIPLFNGTKAQKNAFCLVDTQPIENALVWGASELEKIQLPLNAPPAFLLDSNRLHRHKMNVSVFDNSWDIYDQDLPTAEYFIHMGIHKILLHAEKPHKDLTKILYKYQKKGLKILFTNGYKNPRSITIKKPLWQRH